MTPDKAVAIAMWACFDYIAPHPPEESARIFLDQLDTLGFQVTPK